MQESKVPQVIVRIRNQDVGDDAPAQFFQVCVNSGTVLPNGVDNLQIAVRLVVLRAQHAHRRENGIRRFFRRSNRSNTSIRAQLVHSRGSKWCVAIRTNVGK